MKDLNYALPSKKFKIKATYFSIVTLATFVTCYFLNFNPVLIFTEFHFVRDLLGEMFMPNFSTLWSDGSIAYSILQTIAMAFLGTFYGGLIALIFAFLAAKNIMPYSVIRSLSKISLGLIRVIPGLVVILIFVIAVGPGTFAGVLTLIVSTIGNFGKLFTEVFENNKNEPSEAIYSVGASRMQVIRYSILPEVMPSIISNLLYAFDVNMRLAIGLGIFGGGGIGYKLYLAMRVLHYKDATALIACIIVMVFIIESISNYLRREV